MCLRLLERVRRGVLDSISKRAFPIRMLFRKAQASWERQRKGGGTRLGPLDAMWLALGRRLIFAKVKKRFGGNLHALICGSAPLAIETQQFFMMLGIPVLQVYGLTETTAICTMDDPRAPVEPGYVGPAISGIEMTLADNEEIVVRGPHIFPGYWNRPEETAPVLKNGWFHTGDQGEKNKSRELADYRQNQKSDHSEFRPQCRRPSPSKKKLRSYSRVLSRWWWWVTAEDIYAR